MVETVDITRQTPTLRISESPDQVSEMDREPIGLQLMVDSIHGVAVSKPKKRRLDEARSR